MPSAFFTTVIPFPPRALPDCSFASIERLSLPTWARTCMSAGTPSSVIPMTMKFHVVPLSYFFPSWSFVSTISWLSINSAVSILCP